MQHSKEKHLKELTNEDRGILKSYLIQMVYTYLFMVIAAVIFLVTVVYMIDGTENGFVSANRFGLKTTIVFLGLIILIAVAWIKFEKPVQDIRSGKKEVVVSIVTDKKTNTRWGYHMGVVDFVSKPRLVEYILTVDREEYFVEKDFYQAINMNDQVELNFTYPNRDFFLMKRVN